jgi:hypothetical protein
MTPDFVGFLVGLTGFLAFILGSHIGASVEQKAARTREESRRA